MMQQPDRPQVEGRENSRRTADEYQVVNWPERVITRATNIYLETQADITFAVKLGLHL
jgi:hypothetical protein